MKYLLTAVALLMSTAAIAEPQKTETPQTPAAYTLKITRENVDWIGRALEELPAKVANPIIQDLVRQITEQNQAYAKAQTPPAPADTKEEKPK